MPRKAALAVTLLTSIGIAAAAIPGPQRALCSTCFGLTALGDDVFTDDPTRADELRGRIAAGRARDATFLGAPLQARPRIVVCTTRACDVAFGGGTRAKGTTYGDRLIRFGPLLLTEPIFAHELVHAELAHGHLPWSQPFPAWFGEGLAVLASGDDRYPGLATPEEVRWIQTVETPRQWLDTIRGSGRAYEAARTAVGELDVRLGRADLLAAIREVQGGTPFEQAMAAPSDGGR